MMIIIPIATITSRRSGTTIKLNCRCCWRTIRCPCSLVLVVIAILMVVMVVVREMVVMVSGAEEIASC